MNLRIPCLALAFALTTGCGTTQLASELKPYVGRDIHEVMARLGKPIGQRETSGDRIYVWESDSEGQIAATPFSAANADSGEMTYAGSSSRAGVMPVKFQCTVEVTVDKQNIVKEYQVEGSHAGCRRFRASLSR